jgi:hypothetical protein
MGNGYAAQLLDLIRNGRSVSTLVSLYDFTVLKAQVGNLDGVSLEGTKLTVSEGRGSFVTNLSTSTQLANGSMRFTDRYTSNAYLFYDGLQESGYLVTQNDELLLV